MKEFITNGQWKIDVLRQLISSDMVDYVLEYIKHVTTEVNDKACWMGSSTVEFTVKSAYRLLRKRSGVVGWAKHVCIKGFPSKIAFFVWRVINKCIATDDNLQRMRVPLASKCYCCDKGGIETMIHLLLTAPIAQKL